MDWDTEVDVLCIGAGIGGLAAGIAADEAGAEVMITTAHAKLPPTDLGAPAADLRAWLCTEVRDEATAQYLAALVEGFEIADTVDGAIPTRVAGERPTGTRTVPTFVGARVANWGVECLRSVTGALLSTVQGWTASEMRDAGGRQILVAPVGDVACGSARDLLEALVDGVDTSDIEVALDSPVQRLVFDGGAAVGAVLDGPDGAYSVRARHGVVLSPDLPLPDDVPLSATASEVRVCLVSIPGSRFVRVELLSSPD
ncbi:MAG: hypothetical protein WCE30_15710 [Mycobacterium sp.]